MTLSIKPVYQGTIQMFSLIYTMSDIDLKKIKETNSKKISDEIGILPSYYNKGDYYYDPLCFTQIPVVNQIPDDFIEIRSALINTDKPRLSLLPPCHLLINKNDIYQNLNKNTNVNKDKEDKQNWIEINKNNFDLIDTLVPYGIFGYTCLSYANEFQIFFKGDNVPVSIMSKLLKTTNYTGEHNFWLNSPVPIYCSTNINLTSFIKLKINTDNSKTSSDALIFYNNLTVGEQSPEIIKCFKLGNVKQMFLEKLNYISRGNQMGSNWYIDLNYVQSIETNNVTVALDSQLIPTKIKIPAIFKNEEVDNNAPNIETDWKYIRFKENCIPISVNDNICNEIYLNKIIRIITLDNITVKVNSYLVNPDFNVSDFYVNIEPIVKKIITKNITFITFYYYDNGWKKIPGTFAKKESIIWRKNKKDVDYVIFQQLKKEYAEYLPHWVNLCNINQLKEFTDKIKKEYEKGFVDLKPSVIVGCKKYNIPIEIIHKWNFETVKLFLKNPINNDIHCIDLYHPIDLVEHLKKNEKNIIKISEIHTLLMGYFLLTSKIDKNDTDSKVALLNLLLKNINVPEIERIEAISNLINYN